MRNSKTLELFESFKDEFEKEKINESEEYSFQEIITRMENATDYSELYDAALLIKDDKLRTDVEQAIGQCEDDGDDVETAYSIITSDLLDSKSKDINEGCEKKEIKEDTDPTKELLSRIFAQYPDLSDEDSDYLDSLAFPELIDEIKNRGWEDLLDESEKLDESCGKKKLKEDSYDSGIFYEIEQAFEEAGLNPVRFIDDGILTRNIGWTVSSNGVSQQISCDGSWYDEDEEDLDESEKLDEKINKDNAEINQKILKALRGKRDARAIEPELNKHGIEVNYNPSQGTVLKGPNGKTLADDRKGVYGPSKPGFNNTHAKPDGSYERWSKDYKNRAEEYELKLKQLKDMDRDDIIRKYNDKTTEEAIAAHKADIEKYEKWVEEYKGQEARYAKSALNDRRRNREYRKQGHERDPRSGYNEPIRKDDAPEKFNTQTRKYEKNGMSSADKVDYLNYLTKEPTGYRETKDIYSRGKKYDPADDMNKNMKGYEELKRKEINAKDHLDFQNKYYGVKSDEDLKKNAEQIRARAEEEIKKAQETNDKNKASTKTAQDAVNAAEKSRKDYIEKLRAERAAKANK